MAALNPGSCPVMHWLMYEGRFSRTMLELIEGLALQLRAVGVPVSRVMTAVRTLHPMVMTINVIWEEGEVMTRLRPHGSERETGYQTSPIRLIFEGSPMFRRRLIDADCPLDFPILHDLKARKTTDYLISALFFSDRSRHALSWSTRDEAGFTDEMIALLVGLEPMLASVLEHHQRHEITRTLLQTYVGTTTGQEVLSGKIKRGDRREMDTVILLADMRNFTTQASTLSRGELLARLDSFFDASVRAIHQNQGDVLKFIGDAILAVFPIDAADAAVVAAEAILHNPDQIEAGIALHRGEVIWGNIGSEARLDFTVIGTAVNGTARMADLCKSLHEPVLISGELARLLRRPTRSLGAHSLRGLSEPWALYAPA